MPRSMVDSFANQKLTFDAVLQSYLQALSRLRQWNVRISPQSRLMNYAKRLRTALENETSEGSEQFVNQMLFDLREIDEIIEITSSFVSVPNSEEFKRLQIIAKGSDHPDAESNSKARDAQYELYLRTLFTKAGIVTQQQSPDLFIQSGQYSYPVEAKRPKSEKSVDGLLRDAVRQLSVYSRPGIAALSLDLVARPKGH